MNVKILTKGVALHFLVTFLSLSFFSLMGAGRGTLLVNNFSVGVGPSRAASVAWAPNGTAICNLGQPQGGVQLVSDGTGGAIITWEDRRSVGEYDIYAQRVDSAGNALWGTNGTVICNAIDDQILPQIVSDGAYGAIIIWEDYRNGTESDIYAQWIDSIGTVQWGDNGTLICNATNDQTSPQIVSDGANGAIITWEDFRNGISHHIYAQRVNASGGVEWSINGKIMYNGIYVGNPDHLEPQIVSDNAGGAIVTWQVNATDGTWDLEAQRINATGSRLWGIVSPWQYGISICNEGENQFEPQIAIDGSGGAIVTWLDNRSGTNRDAYAQRVNAMGNIQWNTNGIAICNDTNNQGAPEIVGDGAGGAIIAWQDGRGSTWDIYAQKIASTGEIQWAGNGTAICTASGEDRNPQLAHNGNGGAIITWDSVGISRDIYAQRVNAAGESKWIANGTALCTWTNTQWYPQLINDGFGGAIVAWDDARSGTYDVYANRVANELPQANHPADLSTGDMGTETIRWVLTDDQGPGQYRVRITNASGGNRVWVGLTSWANGVALSVPIDRTAQSTSNYIIEFTDDQGVWGSYDIVVVTVGGGIPGFPITVVLIVAGFATIFLVRRARVSYRE